nr:hypothetical protein [Tanacetum cinerariifolium]
MSNTNNNMQTQTSSALHNAIMKDGGKDRPPMLALVTTFSGNPESKDILTPNQTMSLSTSVLRNQHTKYKFLTTDANATPVTPGNEDSEGNGADDFSELKKIIALLAKAFNRRKIYSKPTNNNLRISSTSQSTNKKQ